MPNRAQQLRPEVSRRTCPPDALLLILERAQRPRSAPRATPRNLKTPSHFVARVRWNGQLGRIIVVVRFVAYIARSHNYRPGFNNIRTGRELRIHVDNIFVLAPLI